MPPRDPQIDLLMESPMCGVFGLMPLPYPFGAAASITFRRVRNF
jgi:hypothetical protein